MTVAGVARAREAPRKLLHVTTASVPLALYAGLPQRVVASGLVALFGVACAVELLRRRSPEFRTWFTARVGAMLRTHERERGITGATWLLATFAAVVLVGALPVAIAATWAGALGDASAAMVGRAWSARTGATGKTLAGTMACAAVTACGAWGLAALPMTSAALVGIAAALAERPALALDDNVRVTTAAALATALLLR
jgi:dolichol kinase